MTTLEHAFKLDNDHKRLTEIRRVLHDHPMAAAAADAKTSLLPLHVACRKRLPLAVVKELLDAYAPAACTADKNGMLPLHWAARGKAAVEVVELVLAANPAAAEARDLNGRTPLELALAQGAAPNILRALGGGEPAPAAKPADLSRRIERHWNASLRAHNVWEIDVPDEIVSEATAIFRRCQLAEHFEAFRAGAARHGPVPSAEDVRERFYAVRAGGAAAYQPVSGDAGGWRSDVCWLSVDDGPTHARFGELFARCGLDAHFGSLVGVAERLRLFCAFFVVRARCDSCG